MQRVLTIEQATGIVNEYLLRRAELEKSVNEIQDAIGSNRKADETVIELKTQLQEIKTKREDLLADVVLDKGDKVMFEQVNSSFKEIVKALEQAEAFSVSANAAIAGLQRKLEEKQAELQEHIKKAPEVAISYYMAQAEETGAEYLQAALTLKHHYFSLRALGSMVSRLYGNPHDNPLTRACFDQISIPLFNTTAMAGISDRHLLSDDILRQTEFEFIRNATAAHQAELSAIGLNL